MRGLYNMMGGIYWAKNDQSPCVFEWVPSGGKGFGYIGRIVRSPGYCEVWPCTDRKWDEGRACLSIMWWQLIDEGRKALSTQNRIVPSKVKCQLRVETNTTQAYEERREQIPAYNTPWAGVTTIANDPVPPISCTGRCVVY